MANSRCLGKIGKYPVILLLNILPTPPICRLVVSSALSGYLYFVIPWVFWQPSYHLKTWHPLYHLHRPHSSKWKYTQFWPELSFCCFQMMPYFSLQKRRWSLLLSFHLLHDTHDSTDLLLSHHFTLKRVLVYFNIVIYI